jgi:soluble lytic murein transglycosylase
VLRIIFPWPHRDLLEREAAEFNLDPFLLVALVRQESAFDADATSRAGARGMMQLMPATARGLARQLHVDWNSTFLGVADANVHLGAAHLAQMLRQYDEVVLALAAYNAGGSRVRRWMRYPEARAGDWFSFTERIPFPETRGYVQTLLRNRELYRALYGKSIDP